MTALVLILVVIAVIVLGGGAALALRSKREYDAGNEVVPGVATRAPASWGGAHTTEAVLHRRLRAAVLAAHAASAGAGGGARGAVEQAALAIDDRLIAAAALPGAHRERALAELARVVDELEQTVASMSRLPSGGTEANALDAAVAEVRTRLDAIEQARAEIEEIDRGAEPPSPSPG